MYPTNFTVLDEMLACSHYRTNPQAIRINQDVPTYFYAVQRSRLPMIAVPLGRGLSDTNTGEVSQNNSTRKTRDHGDSSPTPWGLPIKKIANRYTGRGAGGREQGE